jgi:hypothetical protein
MAISTQKLLGPSKSSSAIVKSSGFSLGKSLKTKGAPGKEKSSMISIQEKVIQVDKLLKGSTAIQKRSIDLEKREKEREKSDKKEKELEKQKPKKVPGLKVPKLPGFGFMGWIKNFIFNTILGFIAVRLIDHMPKILGFVKMATPVIDIIIDFAGNMLDKLITFVDWGYKAYDATRGFIKNLGGDNLVQQFDKFSSELNKFLNLALIVGMSTMSSGGKPGKPGKPGSPGKPGTPYKYDRLGGAVQRNYGHAGRQIYQNSRANGRTHQQALADVRRAVSKGRISGAPQTGSLAGSDRGSKIFGRGLQKVPRRLFTAALGKGGAKAVLKFTRPFLKRLPIIGALIDFGLSVALGEPLGRAAFKAIGAGILGAIGTGFGGPIGAILGGMAGDWAGGQLYDIFFGGKRNNGDKAPKKQTGGPVTRGGRQQGAVKRKVSKKKSTRTVQVTPTKVKPGSAVGGEKRIEVLFPKSEKNDTVNPLGYMEESNKKMGKAPFFGPLFSIATKTLVGDRPSSLDYKKVGIGLNAWMAKSIAFAGGGEVNTGELFAGNDMSNVIAKSVEDSVSTAVDDRIRDLMKQLNLKAGSRATETAPSTQTQEGEFLPGSVPGGQLTMQQLVGLAKGAGFSESEAVIMAAIAQAESGGNSNARNFKPPDKSYGLWQVNMIGNLGPARMQEFGLSSESQLFDPVTNAKAAYAIRKSQGLGAWTVYKTGAYKNFLAQAQAAKGAPSLRTSPVGMTGPLGTQRAGNVDAFNAMAQRFGLSLTSSFRAGDPGYHGKNRARDYSNDSIGTGTPQQLAFAKYLVQNYGSSLSQLIYTPLGFGIANGKRVPLSYWGDSTNAQHYHHVHVALFRGGPVGKGGLVMTHPGEYVVDKDSVDAFGIPFLDVMNAVENKSQLRQRAGVLINALKQYAGYEDDSDSQTVVIAPPKAAAKSMPTMSRSSMIVSSVNSQDNSWMFDRLSTGMG